MTLTVQDLREEFGLKEECINVINGEVCQGCIHVYGTFGGESLTLKFDNIIDFYEFLVEAKNLIENGIWRAIRFTSARKRNTKENKKNNQIESDCVSDAVKIDKRVQEILDQYVEKKSSELTVEENILHDVLSKTNECMLKLEQLGKLTNIL